MASSHSQTKATREAHQSPSECCSPTGSVDESFVVLINEIQEASPKAESKLPLLQPGINAESLEQTTLQSSSTVPQIEANCAAKPLERSTTYDELHNKIELLLMQLITQSITQNNTVLKSQCETLLKWQGDVHKVHKFHRSKFVDAAQIIKQLKDENNRLKHMHQTVSTPPKHGDNSIIMKEVADLKDELQKADELLTRHVEEISSLKDTLATVADEKALLEKSHDDLSAKLSTLTKIHSMQSVELFNMKSSNSMDMISLQEKLCQLMIADGIMSK